MALSPKYYKLTKKEKRVIKKFTGVIDSVLTQNYAGNNEFSFEYENAVYGKELNQGERFKFSVRCLEKMENNYLEAGWSKVTFFVTVKGVSIQDIPQKEHWHYTRSSENNNYTFYINKVVLNK